MIKQITSLVLFSSFIGLAQAQEVTIEKKISKKPTIVKVDTSISLTILIDGDKVIINGKPADKNDPRLKKLGKIKIITNDLNGSSADHFEELDEIEELEGLEADQFNRMAPPPQPMPNKAFLGVLTAENNLGALVNEVSEGSPAEKAGLHKNDIITQVNETTIKSPKDLYEIVGSLKPEDKATIVYLRAGKEAKLITTLAKNKNIPKAQYFNFSMPNMPTMPGMPNMDDLIEHVKKPKLGISIEDLETRDGVKVKLIQPGSLAEKAGFKVNDLIVSLDKNEVKEVSDIKWDYFEAGKQLVFGIKRDGVAKTIAVTIPKKLKTANL